MYIGVFILFFLLEGYAIFFIAFLIMILFKKHKLPWTLIVANLACIGVFLYLKYLVENQELVFVSKYYPSDSQDWGAGLGNLGIFSKNILILLAIFSVIQIIFWWLFLQAKRKSRIAEKIKQPG